MSSQKIAAASDIQFSLPIFDHINAMKAEIDFLAEVEKYPLLSTPGPVLNNAIRRYETVFLPAVAKANKKGTISGAPLDVQWIWHCHMLSPIAYRADCQKLVEYIPDHASIASFNVHQIWLEHADKNEPFTVDLTAPCGQSGYIAQSSWDPVAAVARQSEIYYSISLPHYKDNTYLCNGILRYKMLLQLKLINLNAFLIPCYDIDLAWHTHLLHPGIYYRDTVACLGKIFLHGDDGSGNCTEAFISQSKEATSKLWQDTYNTPMAFNGAMYRGPSPVGKLGTMTTAEIAATANKLFHLNLDRIQVESVGSEKMKMIISLDRHTLAKRRVKGQMKGHSGFQFGEYKKVFSLYDDSDKTMTLSFSHTKARCYISSNNIGHISLNSDDFMQRDRVIQQVINVEQRLQDTILTVKGVAAAPRTGSIYLTLQAGTFSNVVMPETVESMWGFVPLRRLPAGAVNHCTVANHVLNVRGSSEKLFTARVIHSQPLLMSCVQIYYRDRMVAVSHLVGAEQIPEDSNSMAEGKHSTATSNKGQGERTILIKTNQGDRAIIFGHWANKKKGVPAPGFLRFKITRRLGDRSWRSIGCYYISRNHIVIDDMKINKRDGKVEIEKAVDVGEKLCIAFSVAVLTCLCQPPPPGMTPPKDANKLGVQPPPPRYRSTPRGAKSMEYNDGASLNFITAAGWMMPIPSDYYKQHSITTCTDCGGIDGDTCLCRSPF